MVTNVSAARSGKAEIIIRSNHIVTTPPLPSRPLLAQARKHNNCPHTSYIRTLTVWRHSVITTTLQVMIV